MHKSFIMNLVKKIDIKQFSVRIFTLTNEVRVLVRRKIMIKTIMYACIGYTECGTSSYWFILHSSIYILQPFLEFLNEHIWLSWFSAWLKLPLLLHSSGSDRYRQKIIFTRPLHLTYQERFALTSLKLFTLFPLCATIY